MRRTMKRKKLPGVSQGQDSTAALDEARRKYLEWERQDYQEALEGIREGYEDMKAGRIQPAEEVFEALLKKHRSGKC